MRNAETEMNQESRVVRKLPTDSTSILISKLHFAAINFPKTDQADLNVW